MNAFDPDSFTILVTEDFTWRVRELSDLKQVIRLSGSSYAPVARKAALALVYAHWEGYVVFVAAAYLTYIAKRKPLLSKLMPSLHAVSLTSHIQEWQRQRDSIGLRLKMVEVFRSMEGQQFRRVPHGAINAGGNLNFERFADICKIMMINAATIITDGEYLDSEIVGVRNRIAHGGNIVISDERLSKASDFVLSSMRSFRTDIENCVLSQTFMLQ
ncbi:MAE_28990/MAE_18760 family HEPN-like nuclease [Bradyrhizobium cenepequi]